MGLTLLNMFNLFIPIQFNLFDLIFLVESELADQCGAGCSAGLFNLPLVIRKADDYCGDVIERLLVDAVVQDAVHR
jgi:hypothetical protein